MVTMPRSEPVSRGMERGGYPQAVVGGTEWSEAVLDRLADTGRDKCQCMAVYINDAWQGARVS